MKRIVLLTSLLLALILAACSSPAPIVTITAPEDGATVETAQITVTGTVNSAVTALSYTLNGSAAADVTFEGGAFSFEVGGLQEGSNTVTVTASNGSATATDSVMVTYTVPAPAVTITSPNDNAMLTTPQVTVRGTVSSSVTTLSYTLNDFIARDVPVKDGTFEFSDDGLKPGENTFTVTASNGTDTATDSVKVMFEQTKVISTIGSLTADDPTFVRPDFGGGLSDADRTVAYDVFDFMVPTTDYYEILSEQTFDGLIILYKDTFDPTNPDSANLLANNDDGGSIRDENFERSSGLTMQLEAGVKYILVTTACGKTSCGAALGDYSNTVLGGALPPPPDFVLPAPDDSKYNITLRFTGDTDRLLTDAQKQVFIDAAARWQAIITGDLSNIGTADQVLLPPNAGFPNTGAVVGVLDDLLIDVNFENIDGPSGVLGSAGPRFVRQKGATNPYLTIYGAMRFDISEFGNGGFFDDQKQYQDVIVHEMGHVLGIGTVWTLTGNTEGVINRGDDGFPDGPPTVPPGLPNPDYDPRFTGPKATAVYQALLSAASKPSESNVPIANTGGPGNYNGHWRELTFENELMTPYAGGLELLSTMTADSLGDIGYTVNDTSPRVDANYALPLPAEFAVTKPNPTTYVEFEDFLKFSGAVGEVTAPVQAVDLALDNPGDSTSGCEAADFAGFTTGNVALLQRGACAFVQKVDNAVAAGAVGVIMMNQGDDPNDPARTGLFKPSVGANPLPAVTVPYDLGVVLNNTAGLEVRISTPVPASEGLSAQRVASTLRPINEEILFPLGSISENGKINFFKDAPKSVISLPAEIPDR